MTTNPYLFFDGRCTEALEFYTATLGAQILMTVPYSASPDNSQNPPGSEGKIMHARFTVGSGVIMATDGHCAGKPQFEGFALSLGVTTTDDAARYFNALADGGAVRMPLEKTFFSPAFGMVVDKFGVLWMVMTEPAAP